MFSKTVRMWNTLKTGNVPYSSPCSCIVLCGVVRLTIRQWFSNFLMSRTPKLCSAADPHTKWVFHKYSKSFIFILQIAKVVYTYCMVYWLILPGTAILRTTDKREWIILFFHWCSDDKNQNASDCVSDTSADKNTMLQKILWYEAHVVSSSLTQHSTPS